MMENLTRRRFVSLLGAGFLTSLAVGCEKNSERPHITTHPINLDSIIYGIQRSQVQEELKRYLEARQAEIGWPNVGYHIYDVAHTTGVPVLFNCEPRKEGFVNRSLPVYLWNQNKDKFAFGNSNLTEKIGWDLEVYTNYSFDPQTIRERWAARLLDHDNQVWSFNIISFKKHERKYYMKYIDTLISSESFIMTVSEGQALIKYTCN